MADTQLTRLTISELAPRIRAREISPVEVTEAALAMADRLQPTINSFITILHDEARKQAREAEEALARGDYRGPLHGIPHRHQGQHRNGRHPDNRRLEGACQLRAG